MPVQAISFQPSSQIVAVEYDDDATDLFITFKSGGRYVYHQVDSSTVDEFSRADSAGKFLAARIKGVFPYEKVG